MVGIVSPRPTAAVMWGSVITFKTASRLVRRMSATPNTPSVIAGRAIARKLVIGSSSKGTKPPTVSPSDHTEKMKMKALPKTKSGTLAPSAPISRPSAR